MSLQINTQGPQPKKSRKKVKSSGTFKLFSCPSCGISENLDLGGRQNHRRTCTNQITECYFPKPKEIDPVEYTLFFIHQRVDAMFSCVRCHKKFEQDNAIQKHTKSCPFDGPANHDPVSIAWTRLQKNKRLFLNQHAENTPLINDVASNPSSPRAPSSPLPDIPNADEEPLAQSVASSAPQPMVEDEPDASNRISVTSALPAPVPNAYRIRLPSPQPMQDLPLNRPSNPLEGHLDTQILASQSVPSQLLAPETSSAQIASVSNSNIAPPAPLMTRPQPPDIDTAAASASTQQRKSEVIYLADIFPWNVVNPPTDFGQLFDDEEGAREIIASWDDPPPAEQPSGVTSDKDKPSSLSEVSLAPTNYFTNSYPPMTPSTSAATLPLAQRSMARLPAHRGGRSGLGSGRIIPNFPPSSSALRTKPSSRKRPSDQNGSFFTPQHRPASKNTTKTGGFQLLQMGNIDNPQPSPLIPSRLAMPSSRPFRQQSYPMESPLHPASSTGAPRLLTDDLFASPAGVPTPISSVHNPARRLEFTPRPPHPSSSSQRSAMINPSQSNENRYDPYKRALGKTADGRPLFESHAGQPFAIQSPPKSSMPSSSARKRLQNNRPARPLPPPPAPRFSAPALPVPSTSAAGPSASGSSTGNRPPPSSPAQMYRSPILNFYPDYRNPPRTPIYGLEDEEFVLEPMPYLDKALSAVLRTTLVTLTTKCPLCYYQGIPHDHKFDKCPLNGVSKLANRKDPEFEVWKAEISVGAANTHCWSCFIPTLQCVQLPGKRPYKFHKGGRGHPKPDHEGCMFDDTITPMTYLAWRSGNMPFLLERFEGLDVSAITANINTFTQWLVSFDEQIIPPQLLILYAIYTLRGPP